MKHCTETNNNKQRKCYFYNSLLTEIIFIHIRRLIVTFLPWIIVDSVVKAECVGKLESIGKLCVDFCAWTHVSIPLRNQSEELDTARVVQIWKRKISSHYNIWIIFLVWPGKDRAFNTRTCVYVAWRDHLFFAPQKCYRLVEFVWYDRPISWQIPMLYANRTIRTKKLFG